MSDFELEPFDRRTFHGLVAGGALAAAIGLTPRRGLVEPDVEEKVVDGVVRLGLTPSDDAPIELRRHLDKGTFVLAGLTWLRGGEAPSSVMARTRTRGVWSTWQSLAVDPDVGDVTSVRPGTTPLVAPGADVVEVRAYPGTGGTLPSGLRLDLVVDDELPKAAETERARLAAEDAAEEVAATNGAASGVEDKDPEGTEDRESLEALQAADVSVATTAASAAGTAILRPTIRSRARWGADEKLRQNYGEPIQYGRVIGAFVHHTAGTNSYASWEVASIIRGIYRYHVVSRNFYDIGYNILIDRFGRLWEGAYGGLDKAVVAAHTKYYNSSSFGISAIGTYTSKAVEPVVMRGLAAAISWKLAVHGIRSGSDTAWYSGSNAGPKPRIAGHRDTKQTACPGARLYGKLPALRAEVTKRLTIGSRLRIAGPSLVAPGERTTLSVTWRAVGSNVALTGTVNLQRYTGSRWVHVRKIDVTNGSASTVITPGGTNSYRLRASSCTREEIDLTHPRGTSNTFRMNVHDGDFPYLRLGGRTSPVPRGSRTRLEVVWLTRGGRRVTGKVNLQRRRGARWEHVRQLTVVDGRASTVITPGATNTFRLRASSASAPSGVPLGGRDGTSNGFKVTVA